MTTRIAKIFLVASIALLLSIVGVDNLFDYGANLEVVRHILSMDALPPGAKLTERAIVNETVQSLFYWLIIAAEFGGAALCFLGALRLYAARKAPPNQFAQAKATAIAGLTAALALYLTGFMAIGGEWFKMWQAGQWNMQEPAFRFIGMIFFTLIFLAQREPDEE